MHRFSKAILVSLLSSSVFLSPAADAQLTGVLPSSTPAGNTSSPTDPLGRATPSGSIIGFLTAAQSGNYSIAADYLQMNAARRQAEGEQLANELNGAMYAKNICSGRVGSFTQAEGTPQEGVPLGRQRVCTMSSGDVEVDLDLVRVSDPSAGKIWLISADTLTKIP